MRSHADFAMADRRPHGRLRSRAKVLGWIGQCIAIACATFLLLPLMANAIPGDDSIVVKPGGDRIFQCEFTGQEGFPSDTVYCNLRIGNGSGVDASYYMFADETTLEVLDADDNVVTDPVLRDNFIGIWFFHIYTRPVITRSSPEERDVTYDAQFAESCAPRTLPNYDGGPNPSNMSWDRMCDLGVIRGISGSRSYTDLNEPAYERQFRLAMSERDDGTDQSVFKGWGLKFDLVVRAKVPSDDTCPATRVNGVCTVPLYQRP